MDFDLTRFGKFLSGLGLSSPMDSGKKVTLYQGKPDVVHFPGGALIVSGTEIKELSLTASFPITFQELEGIIGLSERIRTAGFPPLEVSLSVNGKVTGAQGRILGEIPQYPMTSHELRGLPASPGKARGKCLIHPNVEVAGKILVLKNSKDLILFLRQRPAGLILEEGNLLSHTGVLAREARIPAIVRVKDATKLLNDGEEIEIDASRGTITRLRS